MSVSLWTPESLAEQNQILSGKPVQDVLQWAFSEFAPDLALSTGFGPSGVVLMHMISRLRPETTVFFIDTGLHFEETLQLREILQQKFGITIQAVTTDLSLERQAEFFGTDLWLREPDRCCDIRKVQPLKSFLANKRAWMTGLRRDQGSSRRTTPLVHWDTVNDLVKINPLVYWTAEETWAYIRTNDLPYHALHDAGYPSVGCKVCTRAIAPGEDIRAGRWSGFSKTECGIHVAVQAA